MFWLQNCSTQLQLLQQFVINKTSAIRSQPGRITKRNSSELLLQASTHKLSAKECRRAVHKPPCHHDGTWCFQLFALPSFPSIFSRFLFCTWTLVLLCHKTNYSAAADLAFLPAPKIYKHTIIIRTEIESFFHGNERGFFVLRQKKCRLRVYCYPSRFVYSWRH